MATTKVMKTPKLGTISSKVFGSCPSCGHKFDSKRHHLLIGRCNHARCYTCVISQSPCYACGQISKTRTMKNSDFYESVGELMLQQSCGRSPQLSRKAQTAKPYNGRSCTLGYRKPTPRTNPHFPLPFLGDMDKPRRESSSKSWKPTEELALPCPLSNYSPPSKVVQPKKENWEGEQEKCENTAKLLFPACEEDIYSDALNLSAENLSCESSPSPEDARMDLIHKLRNTLHLHQNSGGGSQVVTLRERRERKGSRPSSRASSRMSFHPSIPEDGVGDCSPESKFSAVPDMDAQSHNSESLVSLITGSSASALTSGIGHSGSPNVQLRMGRHRHSMSTSRGSSLNSHTSSYDGGDSYHAHNRNLLGYGRSRSVRNVQNGNFLQQRSGELSTVATATMTGASVEPISLNFKPMEFEIPCVDANVPFLGRQWLFHELYEILVKAPRAHQSEEDSPVRGAVIHGNVGTGKTSTLFHLAVNSAYNQAKSCNAGLGTASSVQGSSRLSLSGGAGGASSGSGGEQWSTLVARSVVAYHFCQVDNNVTCHLSNFLRNLVAMMANSPQLKFYGEYLSRHPEIQTLLQEEVHTLQDPVKVFRKALVEPLKMLRKCNKVPQLQNQLILIDGIDESEFHRSPEYGESLASFVIKYFKELPTWLKVVMSVKTEHIDMLRGWSRLHRINLDSVVMDERLYRDVEEYVIHRIHKSPMISANVSPGGGASTKSPTDGTTPLTRFVDHIVSLSKGNFLYLKLVLNLIERGHVVIKSSSYKVLPINLSEVFLLLFNIKFPSEKAFEKVSALLNVCLASLTPIGPSEIFEAVNAGATLETDFLTWENFCDRLMTLFDFLIQREDNTFVLFHPAFREWLTRRDEGDTVKFLCDSRYGHALLALRLSRKYPGGLSAPKVSELGHHILKAHIYKPISRDIRNFSSRDAQGLWVAMGAADIKNALIFDRNIFCPNTKVSRLLLIAGADPNARTSYYNDAPLLCVVAKHGCAEMVSLLLEFATDVCATGSDGLSALMHAAQSGQLDIVQMLHQHGAKLSQVDGENCCSLVHAAKAGQVKTCSFLLQCDWSENQRGSTGGDFEENGHGDDRRTNTNESAYAQSLKHQAAQQAFVAAAGAGKTKVCQFLHEFAEISIDTRDPVSGETALSLACFHGHKDTVQYLLNSHAKIAYSDVAGPTSPLLQAVCGGCWEIVSTLLSKGLDVNVERNLYGQSSLMMAAMWGHIGVMELLLSRDANVDTLDQDGKSALCWACIKDQVPCATLLLDRGANLDGLDKDGKSVLHHAASTAGKHMVQLLLDRGANVDVIDSEGAKPHELAIKFENLEALALFLRKGVKLGPTVWVLAQEKYSALDLLLSKLLQDAILLYKRNRFKESSQRFMLALKKFPSTIPSEHQRLFMDLKHRLLLNFAKCKRRLKDDKAALDLVNQSLALKPQSYDAYVLRARCHKDFGDMKFACGDISEALRYCPSEKEKNAILDLQEEFSKLLDFETTTGRDGTLIGQKGDEVCPEKDCIEDIGKNVCTASEFELSNNVKNSEFSNAVETEC